MMKKSNRTLLSSIVKSLHAGKIEGGFQLLTTSPLLQAFGGTDTNDGDSGTNNCNGGNCVTGCSNALECMPTNTVSGCSGPHNVVAGCGT